MGKIACSSFLLDHVYKSQGIIGADGRHYILDLFRTFPPDANFVGGTEFTRVSFVSAVTIKSIWNCSILSLFAFVLDCLFFNLQSYCGSFNFLL